MDLLLESSIKPRTEGLLPELNFSTSKTDQRATIAWLHAQTEKYGRCVLDLPFKAGSPQQAAQSVEQVENSLPADVCNMLRKANDPTSICLAALHVLIQRYTVPTAALYGVFGPQDRSAPAISFVDSSAAAAPLSQVLADCTAAWRGGKLHARNCVQLSDKMNGSMPKPEVYLSLSDQNFTPEDGVLIIVDVNLSDGTIKATWSQQTLDTIYMKNMPSHLIRLLQAFLKKNDSTPALTVDYLSASDRTLLTEHCNRTAVALPSKCTHHFLTTTAGKLPMQPAVICGERVWNYRELDEWSSRTAAYLQLQHNVGPNTRVGVYMERRVELIGVLLAIMKTGATYVPLDPLYPRDRIAMMVEDGEVTSLVTSEGLLDAAARVASDANSECSIIAIDAAETQIAIEGQQTARVWETDLDSLAYIIFTSGSTGRPKGVPIRHRSLVNFLSSFVKYTDLDSSDTLLAVTTVCFDIAGLELYLPLLAGATIMLASAEEQSDPAALQGLIEAHGVTILQATPVTFRLLLGNGWAGSSNLIALCGGEPLPPDLASQLRPVVRRLLNVYGPTETTIWSTLEQIEFDEDGKIRAPIAIGSPIDNTTVYVVDQNMCLCPPGVRGELVIGGAGVSPGYWQREDLSAGRFVPSPFIDGDILYRTGDLVRWILRGNAMLPILECLGRLDNQVKIRGFRIELAEIESALSTSALVSQVVVDAMPIVDGSTTKELVAYVKSPRASDGGGNPLADSTNDSPKNEAADLDEAAAWGAVYDEAYATKRAATDDPTLNWSGYDNSYTPGKLHKEEVVKEWVERICERINALSYSRVLELGAGNGMIMFRIVKERALGKYIGTDLSSEACRYVEDVLENNPDYNNMPHVSVAEAGAHEAGRFTELRPDLIICNGVSMYFPSATYLLSVINESLQTVEPGGVFFLGDVRCLTLHQHFIASVELFKADKMEACTDFESRVAKAQRQEKEFLVDPEFFMVVQKAGLLQGCARIELNMREGKYHTEFAMYRYDVTFWKSTEDSGAAAPAAEYSIEPYNSASHGSFERMIEGRLDACKENYIAISGVPDARLRYEDILVRALRAKNAHQLPPTTGDLAVYIETMATTMPAVEPDTMYRLAEKHGYKATLMWTPASANVTFDVLFQKIGSPVCVSIAEAGRQAHEVQYTADISGELDELFTNKAADDESEENGALTPSEISQLRSQLRGSLPEYMIPSIFVSVEEFPQTNNGKIDRKSLPKPQKVDIEKSVRTSEFVMPTEGLEAKVAEIWSDAFGLADISAKDNFHDLGGHSLIAMKVINLIKKAFSVTISMADLAKTPTVRAMAEFVDASAGAARGQTAESAGLPLHVDTSITAAGGLPYSVEMLQHVWIPMRDGVRLAARVWLPQGLPHVPNIIEILPYRKSGGTTKVDEATYPYFAGNGFACVRVDSRGTGDSDGDFDDEYSELQQQDGVDVVNWAAKQSWSDGTCGLMGCSWGGFIAMQVATKSPTPLKAIIAVCATDKRLEDDMHFAGGALLSENHSWGAWLLHTLSLPPDPLAVGDSWRDTWLQRIATIQPLAMKWMQRSGTERNERYWQTGTIGETEPLQVPSFLVGGWSAGGYANSVFRLAAKLAADKVEHKAVIGPWAHSYPHLSPIGPQYNFLKDALEWWKQHLGDPSTKFVTVSPRVQLYSVCPTGNQSEAQPSIIPGTWLNFDELCRTADELTLGLGVKKLVSCDEARSVTEQTVSLPDSTTGPACSRRGRWFSFGTSPDRPTDQSDDDASSYCFDCEPEHAGVIFGQPTVSLSLVKPTGNTNRWGTICARLCAVAPSGISTRITYGLINVDRYGQPMQTTSVGKLSVVSAVVTMDHTAFTLPKGYRLRLAVSHGYWPIVAAPELASNSPRILVGGQLAGVLSLSIAAVASAGAAVVATVDQDVCIPVPTPVVNIRRGQSSWTVQQVGDGVETISIDDRGCTRLDGGLEVDSKVVETYATHGEPIASHKVEWQTIQSRATCPAVGGDCVWGFDVQLTSQQTILPGGGVELCTRLVAKETADDGLVGGGDTETMPRMQTVAIREWKDHVVGKNL